MEIPDKVTVVTGASAGIGLATARSFASAGSKVVLAARSNDKLNAIAGELKSQGFDTMPVAADMSDRESVRRLIERAVGQYGTIDILINNAGQAAAGTVADVNAEDFRKIIELNVFGPLYAMQAVIPIMRKAQGGLILNVSSMVSKMHLPGLSAYAATKTALNMLTETARLELASENIRVITVYPRLTATDFGKNSLGDSQVRQRQRAAVPATIVPDTAEFVAQKILDAARTEPAEQYMDK